MATSATEKALVDGMLAGDERAFDRFADFYIPIVHRFAAYRLRGDTDLVEEIVQQTLTRALSRLSTFRGEAALSTWLCAVCRNEIAGHFRRRARIGSEIDIGAADEAAVEALDARRAESPEAGASRSETRHIVHEALDALPAHYGQALEWKYLQELPVREIARRLDLGLKAAESLLTRARLAFRREYDRRVERRPRSAPAATANLSMGMES